MLNKLIRFKSDSIEQKLKNGMDASFMLSSVTISEKNQQHLLLIWNVVGSLWQSQSHYSNISSLDLGKLQSGRGALYSYRSTEWPQKVNCVALIIPGLNV